MVDYSTNINSTALFSSCINSSEVSPIFGLGSYSSFQISRSLPNLRAAEQFLPDENLYSYSAKRGSRRLPNRIYTSSHRIAGQKSLLVTSICRGILISPAVNCLYGGQLITPRSTDAYITAHVNINTNFSRSHEYEDLLSAKRLQIRPFFYEKVSQFHSRSFKQQKREQTKPLSSTSILEDEVSSASKSVTQEPEISDSTGLTSIVPLSCAQDKTISLPSLGTYSISGSIGIDALSFAKKHLSLSETDYPNLVKEKPAIMTRRASDFVNRGYCLPTHNSPTYSQTTRIPAQYAIDYLQECPDANMVSKSSASTINTAIEREDNQQSRWRDDAEQVIRQRAVSVEELRKKFEEAYTMEPPNEVTPMRFRRLTAEEKMFKKNSANLKRSQSVSMLSTGSVHDESHVSQTPPTVKPISECWRRKEEFQSVTPPTSPGPPRRITGTQTNCRGLCERPENNYRRFEEPRNRSVSSRVYHIPPPPPPPAKSTHSPLKDHKLPGNNGRNMSPRSLNRAANETSWPDGIYIKAGEVYKRVPVNGCHNGSSLGFFLPRTSAATHANGKILDAIEAQQMHPPNPRDQRDHLQIVETPPFRTQNLSRSSSLLSLPRSPVGEDGERLSRSVQRRRHNLTIDCCDYDHPMSPVNYQRQLQYRQQRCVSPWRGSLPCVAETKNMYRRRPSPTFNYSYLEHIEAQTMPYRSNTLSSWSDLSNIREHQHHQKLQPLRCNTMPSRKSVSYQNVSAVCDGGSHRQSKYPCLPASVSRVDEDEPRGRRLNDWQTRAAEINFDRRRVHEVRGSWSASPSPPRYTPNNLEEQTEQEIRDQVLHGAPVRSLSYRKMPPSKNMAVLAPALRTTSPPAPKLSQSYLPKRSCNSPRRSGQANTYTGGSPFNSQSRRMNTSSIDDAVDQTSISREFGSNIAFFEKWAKENLAQPHCSFGSDCFHCYGWGSSHSPRNFAEARPGRSTRIELAPCYFQPKPSRQTDWRSTKVEVVSSPNRKDYKEPRIKRAGFAEGQRQSVRNLVNVYDVSPT